MGCAIAQLPPDQPMSLLSPAKSGLVESHDNPMTRTVMAGLLNLDGTQKELFNNLLDTMNRHQKQLEPNMRQFQGRVQQSFGSQAFRAAQLQQQWKQSASQKESHMAGETAFQMVNLWNALTPAQRQSADQHLNKLQASWSSSAAKSLNDLKQKQDQRLSNITSKLTLSSTQQGALKSMVIDPKAVLAWQQGIRNEINALVSKLRAPGANVRVLQASLQPLYNNERYLSLQLKQLEALHGKFSAQQRQQLLMAMK